MAKASATERNAPRTGKESKDSKAAKAAAKAVASGPLAPAYAAIARGDTRTARSLLAALGADLGDSDRAEATALLNNLATDRTALGVSLLVFGVIVLASVLALFTRHG